MREWIRMDSPAPDKINAQVRSDEMGGTSSSSKGGEGDAGSARADVAEQTPLHAEYRVYKRRFFGLFQLVLLNIIVSWDVSCCRSSPAWCEIDADMNV
jgi:hypothetical protein